MKVYYGVQHKSVISLIKDNPLMLNARTLLKCKSKFIQSGRDWFLDSSAYTCITQFGKFNFSYGKYLSIVDLQEPKLFANMDWCCEPIALKSSGLNVLQHIGHTIENGRQLIDYDRKRFVMVIQGWELKDYITCIDYCRDYGLLTNILGIGTVCCRKNPKELFDILLGIESALPDWCKLHCFGLSIDLLKYKEIFDRIDSIDTSAWQRSMGLKFTTKTEGCSFVELAKRLFDEYKPKVDKIIDRNHKQSILN